MKLNLFSAGFALFLGVSTAFSQTTDNDTEVLKTFHSISSNEILDFCQRIEC